MLKHLAKTILHGIVEGTHKQWQRKRSENKIEELTSMEEAESLRVAKDREKWRRVVKMSSNRGQVRSRDKQISNMTLYYFKLLT